MCIKLPIVNGQQWVIHTKALKTIWIKTMLFIASIVYLIPSGSVDGKVKEKKSSCFKTVSINIFIVHKEIVVKHTDAGGTITFLYYFISFLLI